MTQRERIATLESFRNNATHCLVATEVAARGLDISDVARVIHYDLPENESAYTHRSGRPGAQAIRGTSIALVPPSGRRRFEQLTKKAGTRLVWKKVPTASDIQHIADKRLLDAMASTTNKDLSRFEDLASQLLQAGDAKQIVADLLSRIGHDGPCKAQIIHKVTDKPKDTSKRPKDKHKRPSPQPRVHSRQHRSNGSYTVFDVTWGALQGANQSRVLALVCRRGDVRSKHIGAIRVGTRRSTIEVADHLAADFCQSSQSARTPKIHGFAYTPLRG